MSTGILLDKLEDAIKQHTLNKQCKGCLQGSQHVKVSHIPLQRSNNHLDIVWTDVKGPLLDKAIYSFCYFVTFTDDKTRFSWVFPLFTKSEVFAAFRLFETMVERETGLKIKALHMDS